MDRPSNLQGLPDPAAGIGNPPMPARRPNTGVPDSHAAMRGDPPPADEAGLLGWFEEH
jgi:hypothetical protein